MNLNLRDIFAALDILPAGTLDEDRLRSNASKWGYRLSSGPMLTCEVPGWPWATFSAPNEPEQRNLIAWLAMHIMTVKLGNKSPEKLRDLFKESDNGQENPE